MSVNKLPYQRFVRQVSNGYARTKYSYQAMQQDLLQLLKSAPWKIATCPKNQVTTVPNKVSGTDASKSQDGTSTPSSYTYFIDDKYDAYKQGGDAVVEEATMCGYAGLVAYRFKMPASQASNILKVKLGFQISRYLRSGLRVAIQLSDSDTPSQLWETIRGEGTGAIVSQHEAAGEEGVKSWGAFSQHFGTLIESRASDGTLEFKSTDFPALTTTTRYKYMYVYVSVEDYEDWWPLYDATTPRYYSIEGSAQLVGAVCEVTFAGEETVEDDFYPALTYWRDIIPTSTHALSATDFGADWGQKYAGWNNGVMQTVSYTEFRSPYETCALGMLAAAPTFPRRSFTTFSGTKDLTSGKDFIPYEDFQWFEGAKNTPFYDESIKMVTGDNQFYPDYGIIMTMRTRNGISKPTKDGLYNAASITFRGQAFIAPAGKESYQTVKVNSRANISMVSKRGLMKLGINVWRSSSHDVIGPWGSAIMSEMLTYGQMYTLESKTVQAEVTGTGTKNKDQKLIGTADYIGHLEFPLLASDGYNIPVSVTTNMEKSFLPGEMLIFVPVIDQLVVSAGNETSEIIYLLDTSLQLPQVA